MTIIMEEIVVVIEGTPPEIQVTVSEVGLVGPRGKTVELQVDGLWLQYRYVGDPDWIDIFTLADAVGPQGIPGPPGPGTTINLDYGDLENDTDEDGVADFLLVTYGGGSLSIEDTPTGHGQRINALGGICKIQGEGRLIARSSVPYTFSTMVNIDILDPGGSVTILGEFLDSDDNVLDYTYNGTFVETDGFVYFSVTHTAPLGTVKVRPLVEANGASIVLDNLFVNEGGVAGPQGLPGPQGPVGTIESGNVVAASGAAVSIPDVDVATINLVTLTANCTFTFPTIQTGKAFTIVLVQGAGGSKLATWPANVKWPYGTPPLLSTAVGKQDWLSFICADGVNWAGFMAGQDVR